MNKGDDNTMFETKYVKKAKTKSPSIHLDSTGSNPFPFCYFQSYEETQSNLFPAVVRPTIKYVRVIFCYLGVKKLFDAFH